MTDINLALQIICKNGSFKSSKNQNLNKFVVK